MQPFYLIIRKKHLLIVIIITLSLITNVHIAFNQVNNLHKKVNIHTDQTSLNEIIKTLTKDYNLKFSYSNSHIPLENNISIDLKNIALEEAIELIFSKLGVKYRIFQDQVVLLSAPNIKPTGNIKIKNYNSKIHRDNDKIPTPKPPEIKVERIKSPAKINSIDILSIEQQNYDSYTPGLKPVSIKTKPHKKSLENNLYNINLRFETGLHNISTRSSVAASISYNFNKWEAFVRGRHFFPTLIINDTLMQEKNRWQIDIGMYYYIIETDWVNVVPYLAPGAVFTKTYENQVKKPIKPHMQNQTIKKYFKGEVTTGIEFNSFGILNNPGIYLSIDRQFGETNFWSVSFGIMFKITTKTSP